MSVSTTRRGLDGAGQAHAPAWTAPKQTTVWVGATATSFACLCEPCLESARAAGVLFADALAAARVQGELARETDTTFARCAAGHEVVLRRATRPPLLQRDDRQLSLA